MEFNGLVISDSFTMAAIRDFWLSGESATIFIVAGGDIILRPSDINAAMDGILESLKNGILTNDRINKSVFRILAVKYRFGFFDDHLIPNKFDLEEGQLFLDKIMGKYENQNLNN
jgi:beta-N-acetylhexosaminidase